MNTNTEHLRRTLRAAHISLWDCDLCTNQVCYSEGWKQQLDNEDQETIKDFSEWQSRLHPDDLDRVLTSLRAYIDKSQPDYQVEYGFRHKDGSYRWILSRAELEFDRTKKPVRMTGSSVDITEQKRDQNKIKFLTQICATQSQTNQALIESKDEISLFNKICQVVTESGGMDLAWIGINDEKTGIINPVASYGSKTDYLDNIIHERGV